MAGGSENCSILYGLTFMSLIVELQTAFTHHSYSFLLITHRLPLVYTHIHCPYNTPFVSTLYTQEWNSLLPSGSILIK